MAPATKEGPRTAIGGSCSGIADSPTNQTTLVEYDGVIYIDDDDEVQQLLVSTTTTTSTSIESDQMKHRHLATSFCPPTQLTAPNINNTNNNNNNINNKHNDTSMQCTSTKPKQPIQQQQHQQYVARKESDCEDFVIIVDSDSDDATIDSDFADDHQEKKKKKKRAFSELSTNDDDDDDEEAEHKGSADDFSGTQAEYVFDGDNVQFVLDNNDNDSDSDSDYPSAEEEEESEDNAMGGGIVIDSHALKDKDKRIKTQQKLLKLNIEFTGPGLFEDAAFEWVGLPLEQSPLTDDDDTNDDDDDDNNNNNNNNVTKKTVRTQYYSQFMRDGELYKIGDYVYLLPPEEYGDDPYWICRVTELFEDPETREKMLRGFWMWRSFDVRQVDVVEHDPHELFLVEDTQESNSLQTVCGKCTVVYVRDPEEFAPYRDLDDHFYCTSLYDPSSKTIKPLTKQQIAKYNNNNNKDEKEQQTRPYVRPRALDLFSGCGGLSHGFEQAGVDVAWAVEINASAAASFRLNHPMTNMFNVDVLHFYKHLVFMHELRDKYFDADEPLPDHRPGGLIISDGSDNKVDTEEIVVKLVEDAGADCEIPEDIDDLIASIPLVSDDDDDDADSAINNNDGNNSNVTSNDDEDDDGEGLPDSAEDEYEVESILDVKKKKDGVFFQVKWVGWTQPTWEHEDNMHCPELIKDFLRNKFATLPMRGKVDLIFGGPPCQGFSTKNRQRDVQDFLKDKRNQLVFVFINLVNLLKPRAVLIENVRGMLDAGGVIAKAIFLRLDQCGYHAKLSILNAANFGVCQSRSRVIIWAGPKGARLPQYPLPTHAYTWRAGLGITFSKHAIRQRSGPLPTVTIRDVIGDLPAIDNLDNNVDLVMDYDQPPRTHYQKKLRNGAEVLTDHIVKQLRDINYQRCKAIKKNSADDASSLPPELAPTCSYLKRGSYSRLQWDGLFPCLAKTPDFSNCPAFHPEQDRVYSIRESARAFGFPDTFRFVGSKSERYGQIGNAVPVPLGFHLAKKLIQLQEEEKSNNNNNNNEQK